MHFQSCLVATVLTAALVAPILTPLPRRRRANPHAISCKLIKTPAQLQAMTADLSANFSFAKDLDMAGVDFAHRSASAPTGLEAISSATTAAGASNLTINFPAQAAFGVGLFGAVSGGQIQDVTLRNVRRDRRVGCPDRRVDWVVIRLGRAAGGVWRPRQRPVNCNGSCGGNHRQFPL